MLAHALHGILPDLTSAEATEVGAIASAAGRPSPVPRPPLRTPHHDLTVAGLIGGGRRMTPGELTWAHRGLLILDEIGEFRRDTLEALREPLERQVVRLSRAGRSEQFPAAALLVATGNPCGCGELDSLGGSCLCTPHARRHGSLSLSAPIRDRFALRIRLGRPVVPISTLPTGGLTTTAAREVVATARELTRCFCAHTHAGTRIESVDAAGNISQRSLVSQVCWAAGSHLASRNLPRRCTFLVLADAEDPAR